MRSLKLRHQALIFEQSVNEEGRLLCYCKENIIATCTKVLKLPFSKFVLFKGIFKNLENFLQTKTANFVAYISLVIVVITLQ